MTTMLALAFAKCRAALKAGRIAHPRVAPTVVEMQIAECALCVHESGIAPRGKSSYEDTSGKEIVAIHDNDELQPAAPAAAAMNTSALSSDELGRVR